MAWNETKNAPIVRFVKVLAELHTKLITLHALRQTQQALLQIKSLKHSAESERERRLDKGSGRGDT